MGLINLQEKFKNLVLLPTSPVRNCMVHEQLTLKNQFSLLFEMQWGNRKRKEKSLCLFLQKFNGREKRLQNLNEGSDVQTTI